MPTRTLYGRLVLALLILFTLTGIIYVTLTVFTTRLHLQEVTQTLHRSIAANIVKEQWLMRGESINKPALKDIFTRLMDINPSIEVYLLDGEGKSLNRSPICFSEATSFVSAPASPSPPCSSPSASAPYRSISLLADYGNLPAIWVPSGKPASPSL